MQIDLPRMLAALRQKLAYASDRWDTSQHNPVEAYGFILWRLIITRQSLYRKLVKIGRLFQRPFIKKNNMINRMVGIAGGWTDGRDLPPIAPKTFAEIWDEKYRNRETPPSPETEENI